MDCSKICSIKNINVATFTFYLKKMNVVQAPFTKYEHERLPFQTKLIRC